MNAFRHVLVATMVLSAGPALADDAAGPVTHTDQLVVVTPNAPVVITNGAYQAQVAAGPSAMAPMVAAAPNGAPQNEPWDNVSHINGQLVKVGEKSDYILKYKKLNISTNPIGWMFGVYGVSASYAMSQNIAIRGDANIMNVGHESGYEVGISLPIYFRRVYSGPFIEPGLITRGFRNNNDNAYSCSDCSSSDTSMVGPEVLFGWHWTFDSGLNVAFAFGAARDLGSQDSSQPQPAGYFRIGYAM